ncbi:hypothetical protein [Labrys miyagiensis]|nr:hypothetical protein [Labrys miyagiensis]
MFLTLKMTTVTKYASAVLVGIALVASPTLANNGKGGGNGGGNGNSGSHANGHASASGAAGSSRQDDTDQGTTQLSASSLGSLNGFLHASPSALKHASAKSEIGKVAVVYAGLLQNYLSPAQGTTAPTAAEVAAALKAAANKPLSPDIIQAINAKLAATNPTLATAISGYSGGATGLATDISNAI